jgi:hypothetical protein
LSRSLIEGLNLEVADRIREVRTGAYRAPEMEIASSILTGTALYGTVRRVVWEDGGSNPASYPIPPHPHPGPPLEGEGERAGVGGRLLE